MKKWRSVISILVAAVMAVSVAGCGNRISNDPYGINGLWRFEKKTGYRNVRDIALEFSGNSVVYSEFDYIFVKSAITENDLNTGGFQWAWVDELNKPYWWEPLEGWTYELLELSSKDGDGYLVHYRKISPLGSTFSISDDNRIEFVWKIGDGDIINAHDIKRTENTMDILGFKYAERVHTQSYEYDKFIRES
ncbi:MAG: hypothetical protein FWG90_08195 [Oscillospiraceae bacterium]|nr:hypothetical protein [Oscillospiraceae bacterium]